MRLDELLGGLEVQATNGLPAPEITGLTADSRVVQPGWAFFAYRGRERDLHDFAPAAVERGAGVLFVERFVATPRPVAQVVVPNGRVAEGIVAAAFYGHPSRRLRVIGVTGTDGKTTTCTLIHAILTAAGRRAALVTTVGAKIGDQEFDTGLHTTTPRAIDVQQLLASMVEANVEWAVLETTSHALSQHRVAGVDYDIAVLTNVTHDHFDEHGSFEQYRQAKLQLFLQLGAAAAKPGQAKFAIVNADDPSADLFRRAARSRAGESAQQPPDGIANPTDQRQGVEPSELTYALAGPADITARDIIADADGSRFTAETPLGDLSARVQLPGRYNVANALAAIAVGIAVGAPFEAIRAGLAAVERIPGRMERIDAGQDFAVVVDFAHTPNALRQALTHARRVAGATGRVIVVFGCAGERDQAKRPIMGQIAGELADIVVITDEDRRRESVEAIMAEIGTGVHAVGGIDDRTCFRQADRGAAIEFAINQARSGDVVIVCGKGHERSMAFGLDERPWNDPAACRAALLKRESLESGESVSELTAPPSMDL